MERESPEAEAMGRSATELPADTMHGGALIGGAIVGAAVMAVVTGAVITVLVLALGAAVGAVVAGLLALGHEKLRGRANPSADRPMPTLAPDGGPRAQRSEAGHPSPMPRSD